MIIAVNHYTVKVNFRVSDSAVLTSFLKQTHFINHYFIIEPKLSVCKNKSQFLICAFHFSAHTDALKQITHKST